MRRRLVALLVVIAMPVFAQDVDPDRLARARFPDTFARPFLFTRGTHDDGAVSFTPEARGRNALMRPGCTATLRPLAEFDTIDHVAIVRFIPSGDGISIGYVSAQGVWEIKTRGAEVFMTTGDALEHRAPLVPGWNVVEFRCGMDNANTLERSVTVKVNETTLGGTRFNFNGRLQRMFVLTEKRATVVLAHGGVEIGETRRVDQARPRGR